MTKSKKELSILDPSQLSQDNIPQLLKIVSDKIAALKGTSVNHEIIDSPFPGFGIKVKDQTTVEGLIKMHSTLIGKKTAYEASAKFLGISLKKYPFTNGNHTVEEWEADIAYRVNIVKNDLEIKKNERIKTTLEENLSAKDKFQKDMANILTSLTEDDE